MIQYLMSLAKPSPATTPPLDGELGPPLSEGADAISGTAGGGGSGGLAPIDERLPGGGQRITIVVEGATSIRDFSQSASAFCGKAMFRPVWSQIKVQQSNNRLHSPCDDFRSGTFQLHSSCVTGKPSVSC